MPYIIGVTDPAEREELDRRKIEYEIIDDQKAIAFLGDDSSGGIAGYKWVQIWIDCDVNDLIAR